MWGRNVESRVVLPLRSVLSRGYADLCDGLRCAQLHFERGTDSEGLAHSFSTRPC